MSPTVSPGLSARGRTSFSRGAAIPWTGFVKLLDAIRPAPIPARNSLRFNAGTGSLGVEQATPHLRSSMGVLRLFGNHQYPFRGLVLEVLDPTFFALDPD